LTKQIRGFFGETADLFRALNEIRKFVFNGDKKEIG
jgi:hypothetical protein